jgi:hypothetical protein
MKTVGALEPDRARWSLAVKEDTGGWKSRPLFWKRLREISTWTVLRVAQEEARIMAQTRKVRGRATKVQKGEAGNLVVRFHTTDVVTVYHNGTVILRTGGWKTATTKLRMNQAANQFKLGYLVYQKDKNWFVTWKGKTTLFHGKEIVLQ